MMLRIRIVSSVSPSGDVQYYLTNLDIQSFSASEIGCIYRKRWQVETAFRHLKYGVGAIVFHSKFLLYQEMELYAALTLYNCVAAIINHILFRELMHTTSTGTRLISKQESCPACTIYSVRKSRRILSI